MNSKMRPKNKAQKKKTYRNFLLQKIRDERQNDQYVDCPHLFLNNYPEKNRFHAGMNYQFVLKSKDFNKNFLFDYQVRSLKMILKNDP